MLHDSFPHWLALDPTKGAIKPIINGVLFTGIAKNFRIYFKSLTLSSVERYQGEFLLVILEKSSQFEVVLRIKVGFYCHIVLNEFEELFLEFVNFGCDEEGVNECEICV